MMTHDSVFRLCPLGILLALAGCEVTWDGRSTEDIEDTNEAPVLSLDAPVAGGTYGAEAAVPISGTVSDDGKVEEIYLTVTSNVDGLITRPEVDTDGSFSSSGLLTEGSHQVTVTATDTGGLQATLSVSIQVEAGGGDAPILTVSLSPDPPMGREWTECVIAAEDPNGLEVTVEATWLVNDEDRGTALDEEINALARDDTLTCEVTASSAGGSTEGSVTATVANSPPEVEEVIIDGDPADENGVLSCAASVFDYDQDTISLIREWFVNGVEVLEGPGELNGTYFDRDDEVICRVTPDDGYDAGESVESEVHIILNTTPSEPTGISVTPESVPIGGGLTCSVETTGEDIDTHDDLVNEFLWTSDGVEVTGATAQVLGTSDIDEGALITCSARTSDGDLFSAWVAATNTATVTEGGLEGTYEPSDAWTTLAGTTDGDRLGRALASAGDLDGDGFPELVLGANQHDSNRGQAFVFDGATVVAGGELEDLDALVSWEGPAQGALFAGGEAIIGQVDVTGEGTSDVLVGAYQADDIGAGYLFAGEDFAGWGDWSADDEATLIFRGDNTGDKFSLDMGASDVDGDGLADVFIGAPENDEGGENAGMVTIYLGAGLPSAGDVDVNDADHAFEGEQGGDLAGYAAMEAIGDIDGDGYGDFSVGARDARNSSNLASGSLFVLSGAEFVAGSLPGSGTLADAATVRIDGEESGDQLGMSATSLGDLDGDGAGDLAVGIRYADIQTLDAGGVSVFFGSGLSGTTSAADADASFGSEGEEDLAGKNVVSGDIDGDGIADLLVSSHYHDGNGSNSGTAWLLLGGGWASWAPGDTLSGTAHANFQGASNNDWMSVMSELVDLDGDGLDELVIGSDGDSENLGAVFVFAQP